MNFYILLFLIYVGCEDVDQEKPTPIFMKTFGGTLWDYGNSVQQTKEGGYIIVGETSLIENGSSDIWLIKTDFHGNEEWIKTFDGSNRDYASSIQETIDGGYVFTGSTGSGDYNKAWLIKTDSQGNEDWNQTFGGGNYDRGNSVQQTNDGGYIITGEISSSGNGSSDVLLIKTDHKGNKEWEHTFGGVDYDRGYSVQQTRDGGFIIAGSTRSNGDSYDDLWLIKADSQGNEEWNRTFGGGYIDIGHCVYETTDNGYVITGYTQSYGNGSRDLWLIKTDSQGNEEWNRTFGDSFVDFGKSVQQTIDGGYIITGSKGTDYHSDVWLIKTDAQGNEQWNQLFGGVDYDFGNFVRQTNDNGYIITGHTKSYGNGGYDVLLIKTDSKGQTKLYTD